MDRHRFFALWGGGFAIGALLLTFSVLFLTTSTCGLLIGTGCTLDLHWPTILPALALIVLTAFKIAWASRPGSSR